MIDVCREVEERSKMDVEKRMLLELEIDRRRSEFELLESKCRELEVEKLVMQDEVKELKRRNFEFEERINRVEKEYRVVSAEVVELKIESNILHCEKKSAEREAEVCKLKCAELELRMSEVEKENLVLRSGQSQLTGMPEMQTTKGSNLKNEIFSEHLETENRMISSSPVQGIGDLHAAGTPFMDVSSKQFGHVNARRGGLVSETEKNHHSRVRKQLEFGEGVSLNMKLAPPTPGVARPSFGIIEISEDEVAIIGVDAPCDVNRKTAHVSTDFSARDTMGDGNKNTSDGNFKRNLSYQIEEEDMRDEEGSFPLISTPKRKRATNIVTTEGESDGDESDDNIPISKMLKRKHLWESNCDSLDSHLDTIPVNATLSEEKVRESTIPRRHLVALRERSAKDEPEQKSCSNSSRGGANYNLGIPKDVCVDNDEVEEDQAESDVKGENLDGSIVSSSDISESDDGSNESEDLSDDNVDFQEVSSKLRRSRGHKVQWEYEGDMLAAFCKDRELCMKAVCALHRRQTEDEKIGKFTYELDGEGFNQRDAFRGTTLAKFLTGGDPLGDVKKSVKELQEFDAKAPALCRTLAIRYSKQLLAIYKSKEDPLCLPS